MIIGAMLLAKPDKLEDRNKKISDEQNACRDIIKEVTKTIFIVLNKVNDKAELELSWVGEITKG